MANHKSAKKRARQTLKRNTANHGYLSAVRTAVKGFRLAVEELASAADKDLTKIQPMFTDAQSKLMKAVSKGIVKKNTAARTISRMAFAIKKSTASSTADAVAKKKVTKKKATKKKVAKKKTAKKK